MQNEFRRVTIVKEDDDFEKENRKEAEDDNLEHLE
jgi:hypothetical protein